MRQTFYTSPIDHDSLADWPDLATRLHRAAKKALGPGGQVEVGDEPVFGYGPDGLARSASELEETLLGLEELDLDPRTVRIDLWCAIVGYGAIRITLGDGIVRKERRALEKGFQKALRGETLIRESEGAFDRYEGRVYGYRLDPNDDRDRSTLAGLLMIFDSPLYLAERWLLQGDDEAIDENRYSAWPKTPSQYVQFTTQTEEAEEHVWCRAALGEGLIAVYPDDPDIDDLIRHFARHDDLRRFPKKRWDYRLTVGRCRPEDNLVVVYDLDAMPTEEAEWAFVI